MADVQGGPEDPHGPRRGRPLRAIPFYGVAVVLIAGVWHVAGQAPLADDVSAWLPWYFGGVAVLLAGPWLWPPDKPSRPGVRLALIVLCAAAMRLPLLGTAPTLSDDVYRYVWEGRLVALGGDPWDMPPADLDLSDVVAVAPEWGLINHPELPAIYPAGAQWFFALVTVADDSERAMRIALTVVDLLLVVVLGRLLLLTRRRVEPVVLYAWHPLVVIEVSGSGHYEPLAILPMIAGLLLMHELRPHAGWLAWGAALATKYLGALPALFALRAELRRYGPAAAFTGGVLLVSVIVLLSLPFALDGSLPVGSTGTYAGHWAFNGALHTVLEPRVGYHPARWICLGLLVLWTGWVFTRGWSPARSSAWVFAGVLYLSPVVHPWYGLWLLALVPLFPTLFALLLTGLLPLAYLAWSSESAGGPWAVPDAAWRAEYGLPLAGLVIDWRRRRRPKE